MKSLLLLNTYYNVCFFLGMRISKFQWPTSSDCGVPTWQAYVWPIIVLPNFMQNIQNALIFIHFDDAHISKFQICLANDLNTNQNEYLRVWAASALPWALVSCCYFWVDEADNLLFFNDSTKVFFIESNLKFWFQVFASMTTILATKRFFHRRKSLIHLLILSSY